MAAALVCLVALVALVTAGCSSGASTSASTTSTTVAPPPALSPELLVLSDLPAGWSVNSTSDTVTTPACLASLSDHAGADAHASVRFHVIPPGLPDLTEDLGHFPKGAAAALRRINRAVARCRVVTFISNGQTFAGTIEAIPPPSIGDESFAYQVHLSDKDFAVGFDVIVSRVGDTAMAIVYGTAGTPDLAQVEQIATLGIDKLT